MRGQRIMKCKTCGQKIYNCIHCGAEFDNIVLYSSIEATFDRLNGEHTHTDIEKIVSAYIVTQEED